MFDPMSDLASGGSITDGDDDSTVASDDTTTAAPAARAPQQRSSGGSGGGKFADELHSVAIHARQRTFYIDLKESTNGKFFKVSEKSRGGQKTTIMFDSEDLEPFIKALEEMREFV
ncbi:MAG: hypothetical protein HOG89_02810 [Candidatus Peribacter sp.]|jgi:hypothetical protein|nr:hypothetical protein [Candidatus Peribacter sp.]MBT4392710.1 hypothetical protein [Candidatus Peribacter sp.]MBT4600673.1 hypothetical protein [Candidatus Peribacter sp.]MBT5148658.1 hypothetical protein [Candidatus Peribacter sp.]MBT5637747.1 hypothetical protein [Candidatus Peribacter sp.]